MTRVEEALAAIDGWVADGLVPGAAAVVVDARGVLAERYAGVRERRGDEPVGPDTLFALASLTKPLVGAACMVALEEGLLDLDAEVRDGFALRHLLSHCAGPARGRPALAGSARVRAGDAALVLERRLRPGGAPARGRVRDALRRVPARGRARPARAWTPRSVSRRPTRRATARVWQSGRYGEDELFNSERFRARRAAAGRRLRERAGLRRRCSPACSRGGAAGGGALLAAETVEEMLAPQFGPLPGGVDGVGEWPNLCWGLGFDVRGQREPHWAGASLGPRAAEPLRRLGDARLARPRARARPRRAREPRQLQRLVARAVGGAGRAVTAAAAAA